MDFLREIGRYARMMHKNKRCGNHHDIADMQSAIDHVRKKHGGHTRDAYGTTIIKRHCYPNTYGDEDTLPSDVIGRAIEVSERSTRILTISTRYKIKIKKIEHEKVDIRDVSGKRGFYVKPMYISLRLASGVVIIIRR